MATNNLNSDEDDQSIVKTKGRIEIKVERELMIQFNILVTNNETDNEIESMADLSIQQNGVDEEIKSIKKKKNKKKKKCTEDFFCF
jgi:hypothetical protein